MIMCYGKFVICACAKNERLIRSELSRAVYQVG